MLKENELIGALTIYRQEVRPFADKQIALVTSFATQAVIAVENARLLNELRESLQEQTATAEVLQVINSSPGDLEPVFARVLEKAVRICEAKFGVLYRYDDAGFEPAALSSAPPAYANFVWSRGQFFPQTGNGLDRLLRTTAVIHTVDEAAEPVPTNSARLAGGALTGSSADAKGGQVGRGHRHLPQEVRPFSDKQIEAVNNFAAQAVIAIENARLLSELREFPSGADGYVGGASGHQQLSGRSSAGVRDDAGERGPHLRRQLRKHLSLGRRGPAPTCIAQYAAALADARKHSPLRPYAETPVGRMVVHKAAFHLADMTVMPGYIDRSDPGAVAAVELGGVRTILAIPMLKENEMIGSFSVIVKRFGPSRTNRSRW